MTAWPEFYFDSEFESASKIPSKASQLMKLFTAAAKEEMQRREMPSADINLAKILVSIARLKPPKVKQSSSVQPPVVQSQVVVQPQKQPPISKPKVNQPPNVQSKPPDNGGKRQPPAAKRQPPNQRPNGGERKEPPAAEKSGVKSTVKAAKQPPRLVDEG